ncbi:MAG TPA: hypothetical protein VEW94_05640 [Chloroflexia bacterium]|nr:hypothetical protein [Chloroflexia bacterium]
MLATKDATESAHVQTAFPWHRVRLVLFALLSAFFSFGCMTWTTMVEVTSNEEGQHLIGTSIRYEFNKRLWDELDADERKSVSQMGDPLKEQGWKVETSDGGRIINMTRDPAPLDKLSEQGWAVNERALETGRIVTATLPFLGAQGTKSDEPAKEPVQNITVVIDESDPAATRYTYRSKIFIDLSEQAPDSGSSSPPPSGEDSWGAAIAQAIEESPDVQRLEQALKEAGPPKLIIGTALPGTVENATINGEPGGTLGGNTVEWTIDLEKSGTYNLEATALGTQMELAITQFDIEGNEVTTPDGPAYSISDTLKVNVRVAGQNKETKKQDFEKFNPISVKLYYDDKEIDTGQTDEGGNVSFSFTPPAEAPAADTPAGDAPAEVSSHTLKVVASKKGLKDAEESKKIQVSRVKKEVGVDLTVDHIEVVQVIQDVNNSIPLVANKKTVVRVFVVANGSDGSPVDGVTASLTVRSAGADRQASLINGPIKASSQVNRADKDGSLNFELLPGDTVPGVRQFVATVNPGKTVKETDYDNNNLKVPLVVTFDKQNVLRIGYVRVGWLDSERHREDDYNWPGDPSNNHLLLKKIYPIAEDGLQYYEMPFRVRVTTKGPFLLAEAHLQRTLRTYYNLIVADPPDQLAAWVPAIATMGKGGQAEAVRLTQLDPVGRVSYMAETSEFSLPLAQRFMAHEIGHNLGLKHTGTKGDADCTFAKNDDPFYWGSDSAKILEIGYDIATNNVIPDTYYDLMAYCPPAKSWISPRHYKTLFGGGLQASGINTAPISDTLIIQGRAWDEGQIEIEYTYRPFPGRKGGFSANRASLALLPGASNLIRYRPAPITTGEGDYCARFSDANGETLGEHCFDLDFEDIETGEPLDEAGFSLKLPYLEGTSKVSVLHNGEVGATIEASSGAPTVNISSPAQGETWDGQHTVSWSAEDSDGDALNYAVLYSPDGGKAWFPLSVNSQDAQLDLDTTEIAGGDNIFFRVLASDGLNTSQSEVGPITVPNSPPYESHAPPSESSTSVAVPPTAGAFPAFVVLAAVAGGGVVLLAGAGLLVAATRRRPRPTQVPLRPQAPTQARYAQPAPPNPYTASVEDPFTRAERQFSLMNSDFRAGRISPAQYEAAVQALRVQDVYGRHWQIGPDNGKWHVYDGQAWVQAQPPRPPAG